MPAAPSAPAQRRRRRRARWPLVLLLLLPFVAVEVVVRQVKTPTDLWFLTGRSAVSPEAEWAFTDAFSAYTAKPGQSLLLGKTVNSHGFISTPELDVAKPAGVLRVAFLGGSSTAGTGENLLDHETWPWRLAELLGQRAPGQRIEFINAALGGYSTFESHGRLWSRLRFFEPDVVVLYHGWNEMYYFTERRVDSIERWRRLADGDWTLQRTDNPHAQFEPWAIDHLIRWSQLLTKLRLRLGKQRAGEQSAEQPKALRGDFDPRAPEVYRTNLRLIASTCEVIGAELFVVKQATLIAPGNSAADRARCRVDYHGFDADAHLRAYAALHAVVDDEIPAGRVIDGSRLDGRSELFADHVHPTPAGARALAELVAEPLAAWIAERD